MRRMFWFLLGAGTSAYVMTKGRKLYHQVTPQGVQEQISARTEEAGAWLADFGETFTQARRRREEELASKLKIIEKGRTP